MAVYESVQELEGNNNPEEIEEGNSVFISPPNLLVFVWHSNMPSGTKYDLLDWIFSMDNLESEVRRDFIKHLDSTMDRQRRRDSVALLTPLMVAGADVYATVQHFDGARWCTLMEYAENLGLEDVWDNALRACGYSPEQVRIESDRRLADMKRLDRGDVTGVDRRFLSLPDASGLKPRPTRARECR